MKTKQRPQRFLSESILNNLLNNPSQNLNSKIPEDKLCPIFLTHQELTYQEVNRVFPILGAGRTV